MEARRNILIVDDDAEFASMVAQAVSDLAKEYDVKVATDVNKAMAEIRGAQASQRPFDLVITDIKMPGSSGLRLLEALEQVAPGTKAITMTAYHSPELAARAQELSVHAYLIKPIVLSEFRQIVREALMGPALAGAKETEPLPELTATRKAVVERQLANLRKLTDSAAALLIHANGTILASDCLEPGLEAGDLCEALINAQQTITQEIMRALGEHALGKDSLVKQSYYGTDTYSICTYRLDDSHIAATIFGSAIREGQVWYYMREVAQELERALTAEAETLGSEALFTRRPDHSGDVFDMLDHFFPDHPKKQIRTRRVTSGEISSTKEQPADIPDAGAAPERSEAASAADRLPVDEIDWNVSTDLAKAPEEETESTTKRQAHIDRPSIDEINWNALPNVDWEGLVADTDQGFRGMSFEEAKRQGLIDDLEAE